jgi:hypothetical protein
MDKGPDDISLELKSKWNIGISEDSSRSLFSEAIKSSSISKLHSWQYRARTLSKTDQFVLLITANALESDGISV